MESTTADVTLDEPIAVGLEVNRPLSELEASKAVASDTSRPIVERIDAFDDILESEVGDTPLLRARNLERQLGFRQLYLKFEGANPTGTQKDRIAFAQTKDALRRGYDGVTIASCGNYGAAMAFATSLAGLRCWVHIPESYHAGRLPDIEQYGAHLIRQGGDYETAVAHSREQAVRDDIYDANPGGQNTTLQLQAYGQIAYEIYDELRDAPAAVGLALSNGSTLAGVYRGFLGLYRRGKTSRFPRMVGGSSPYKNPILQAWLHQHDTVSDLEPERIHETAVNEPLINWHSIDGNQALEAIRTTGGWAANASDRALRTLSRLLREREGILVQPAACAGLQALISRHEKTPLPGDRYVAVLTARR